MPAAHIDQATYDRIAQQGWSEALDAPLAFGSGRKPGHSTDADALNVAQIRGTDTIVKPSGMGIYWMHR